MGRREEDRSVRLMGVDCRALTERGPFEAANKTLATEIDNSIFHQRILVWIIVLNTLVSGCKAQGAGTSAGDGAFLDVI